MAVKFILLETLTISLWLSLFSLIFYFNLFGWLRMFTTAASCIFYISILYVFIGQCFWAHIACTHIFILFLFFLVKKYYFFLFHFSIFNNRFLFKFAAIWNSIFDIILNFMQYLSIRIYTMLVIIHKILLWLAFPWIFANHVEICFSWFFKFLIFFKWMFFESIDFPW